MLRTVVLSAALALSIVSPACAGREDQWVFRETLGDGQREPTAVFMDWSYSAVLFRASCDPASGEFVLRYFGDRALMKSGDLLGLRRGWTSETVSLATRLVVEEERAWLEGRLRITPDVRRRLAGSDEFQIDAPNEMDEAWYVGQAKPLFGVMERCASAR